MTQEPDALSYRVCAPLVGTVKLAIGQVVDRATVETWLPEPSITVRIVGITPSDEQAEQLDLFKLDAPKKQRRAARLPAAEPLKLPAAVKG